MNESADAKSVSLAIYLNKALCHQKLNDLDEVKHAVSNNFIILSFGTYSLSLFQCEEALALDPKNVKAFFRRGQALLSLGEVDKALGDFERANKIEPENKAAINQISICKQKIREYEQKEKATYRNMFRKFADNDNTVRQIKIEISFMKFLINEIHHLEQKERAHALIAPDVMANSKFGEWKAEEHDHEPSSFEKENPDILMINGASSEEFKNM